MKQFSGRGHDERPMGSNLTSGLSEQGSCAGTELSSLGMNAVGPDQKPSGIPKQSFTGEHRGGDSFRFC